MKAQMTLASKKDKKPTISAKIVGASTPDIIIRMKIHENDIIKQFHLSRDGKTYYANDWDADLPLPRVSKPLIINLISIKHIIEQKLF